MSRESRDGELDADKIGLKSELEFLRALADILAPPDGGAPDVRRAVDAISTMRMALSRAPRSETAPAWIAFGERKPNQNQTILATNGEIYTTGFWNGLAFFADVASESDPAISYTHWMPMPNPPGER